MSKTVRVRIAVAVTPDGQYNAVGWSSKDKPEQRDRDMRGSVIDYIDSDEYVVLYIEADVPVPSAATVEGKVMQ